MARMSIDDQALRDPRMIRLARALGWSRRETLGCLLDVWALCYDRAWHVIPSDDIDTAAERPGFHVEMIAVGLAESADDGIRVAGAAKRVAYLQKLHADAHSAGEESGRVRRESVGRRTNDERNANRPGNLIPTVPDSASASVASSVPASVPDHDPVDPPKRGRGGPRPPKAEAPADGWQDVVDAFTTAYRAANGRKPSWSTPGARRALRPLSAIVREHGAVEVMRRIDLVHATPPKFPPGPWTIDMFVQHFDRLVIVEPSARGPVNHAQAQLDRQLDRVGEFERRAREVHDYDGNRPNECMLCGQARDHALHAVDSPPYERAAGAPVHDVEPEDRPPWE